MSKGDEFKFVLIGLDGGIKEKRSSLISTADLFSIIDKMSMRKVEMNRNN